MRPGISNNLSPASQQERGTVLIIVLWVALGLVSIALYFASSMNFEMRAADNSAAAIEAQQAIAGAARYVTSILSRSNYAGMLPELLTYKQEAVPIGDARFWLIGRPSPTNPKVNAEEPVFGLVDEASKLNLNTATLEMLQQLPGMTAELAGAIIDWRDSDQDLSTNGAEDETYGRRNPPYRAKNAKFESVDELRLVNGAYLDILYAEDANLNGTLDLNENDADGTPPADNHDGRLDSGIFEYVTVWSHESNLRADGSQKLNINDNNPTNRQAVATVLEQSLGADRANAIQAGLTGGNAISNMLTLYIRSRMTPEEFLKVEPDLAVSATAPEGLINISTASEAVLACIPGIGIDKASTVVAYRQTASTDKLATVAWILDALDQESALQAAPYITAHSYQFSADIAAVGHYGRGYQRVKFVFDTSEGAPKIRYRQDLSHLGWALGRNTRQLLLAEKDKRW
jgi:type II secretory pathway component PulK